MTTDLLPHRGITECICIDGAYDPYCEGCKPENYMSLNDSIFYWRNEFDKERNKKRQITDDMLERATQAIWETVQADCEDTVDLTEQECRLLAKAALTAAIG